MIISALKMSIFSNVTEQGLKILCKLAQQQKSQRAEKNKNRILKQTHDVKLAESLSPITTKLYETSKKLGDVIKESTQNLGKVMKENNTPQLAIEKTPAPQPIGNNEKVIHDVDLENNLKNMTTNTGFFKTYYDNERGWIWNGYPVKMLRGNEVEINDKNFKITPNLQKDFTQTSNIPLKKLNDQE